MGFPFLQNPCLRNPFFGIPTVGIPAFGIPTFGILVEFRHPLVRHPLDSPQVIPLVAPYCAIPRDYLSDTPLLLRAMGFLVSQHGQTGAIPPPPFASVSPLTEHTKWRCDTPPQKGYLSDTCAIPYENKQMGSIPPSAILSRKGIARYGGYLALGR